MKVSSPRIVVIDKFSVVRVKKYNTFSALFYIERKDKNKMHMFFINVTFIPHESRSTLVNKITLSLSHFSSRFSY